MAIVKVKTSPSIAFMIVTGHTLKNDTFYDIDLDELSDRDILSLDYAINNHQLIGETSGDKTAINNAAAALGGGEGGGGGSYELPIASESILGGVKIGENLSMEEDGTLNAESGGGSGTATEFKIIPWNPAYSGEPIDPTPTFGGQIENWSSEGDTMNVYDDSNGGYKAFLLNSDAQIREDQKVALAYTFTGFDSLDSTVGYEVNASSILRFQKSEAGLFERGEVHAIVDPDYVAGTPFILLIDGDTLEAKVITQNGEFTLQSKYQATYRYGITMCHMTMTASATAGYAVSMTASLDLSQTGELTVPVGYNAPRAFDENYNLPTSAESGRMYKVTYSGEFYDGIWFNENEILIFTSEYDFITIPPGYKGGGDDLNALFGFDSHGVLTQVPLKGYRGDLRPSETDSGFPDIYQEGDMFRVIENGYIYMDQVYYVNKNDIVIIWFGKLINITSKPRDAITCVYPLNEDDGGLVASFGYAPLYTNYYNRQAFRYIQTGNIPTGNKNVALNSSALDNPFLPEGKNVGVLYNLLGCSEGASIRGNGVTVSCFDDSNAPTMSVSAGFQIDSGSVSAYVSVDAVDKRTITLPYGTRPEDCSVGIYYDAYDLAFSWVLNGVNQGIIPDSIFTGTKYVVGLYVDDGTSATPDAYISGELVTDASRMGLGFPEDTYDICGNKVPQIVADVISWDLSVKNAAALPVKTAGSVGTVTGDAYDHVGTAYPNNNSTIEFSSFGMVSDKEQFFIKSNGLNSIYQSHMIIGGILFRFENNSIVANGELGNPNVTIDAAFTDGAVARFALDMNDRIMYVATTNVAEVELSLADYAYYDDYNRMEMYTSNLSWGGELHLRFSGDNDYESGLGKKGYSPVGQMRVLLPDGSKDGSILSILSSQGGSYNHINFKETDGAIVVNKEAGIVIGFGATQQFVEDKIYEAVSALPIPIEDAPVNDSKYVRMNNAWEVAVDPLYMQELTFNADGQTEVPLGSLGDCGTLIIDGTEDHAGLAIESSQMPYATDMLIYPKINIASITWKDGYTVAGGTLDSLAIGEIRVVRRLESLGLILIIN